MRVLIETLLSSVVQLGNILLLAFFIFGIFAILGLSFWAGQFYYRCRLTPNPVNGEWPLILEDNRICGVRHTCDVVCGSLYEAVSSGFIIHGDPSTDTNNLNFSFNINVFDNILLSMATIFQVSTLEGWTNVMYQAMDSTNYYVGSFFFVICACVTAYFIYNLAVAVMLENFEALHEEDT
jgi:voltage-dependent calcium channel